MRSLAGQGEPERQWGHGALSELAELPSASFKSSTFYFLTPSSVIHPTSGRDWVLETSRGHSPRTEVPGNEQYLSTLWSKGSMGPAIERWYIEKEGGNYFSLAPSPP